MALIEIKKTKYTSLNSRMNVRYVYENTLYYDDVLNKKITKRRVVGKIDPDSGAEVKTGPVGRPKKEVLKQPLDDTTVKPSGETIPPEVDSQVLDTISFILSHIVNEIETLQNCVKQLQPSSSSS